MNLDQLPRIQAALRSAASRHREIRHPGPFLVTVTRENENPYLNYAIPEDGAIPTPEDVAQLVAAFLELGRRPRLEYIPNLAPAVEPSLTSIGFEVESRTPLMVLPRVVAVPIPSGIELVEPKSDEEVRELMTSLNEAFGMGEAPTEEDVARQRSQFADGLTAILARDTASGEPVGGGYVVAPEGGIAEVAGIGVREAYRCRGIGAAITGRLTALALERGTELPFLMAATEREAKIYAQAGFETVGEVLHISLPQ
jgi:N-acetylglutamate synthase-like GNAT family acetyltransferase